MLIVTDLQGRSEPLINTENTTIRQRMNENHELTFSAIKTKNNIEAYEMLVDEAMVTCNGENFIIKSVQEFPYSKNVMALHEFFEMIDDFVESELPEGNYSINQALFHAFTRTAEWYYIIEDEAIIPDAFLSGFGADNGLALFNKILDAFQVEYEIHSQGKFVRVKKKIGVQTEEQVRFKHNLSSINRDTDSSHVKTAIKAYYNPDGYGGYQSNTIYLSPNVNNYRKQKWAAPLYLDHVYTEEEALRIAESQLNDVPSISIATTFVELKNSGYNVDNIALGNSFYLIDERMNLNESVRIVEIESYPLDEGKSPSLVCANSRKIIENVNVNQQQQQNTLNREAVKQSVVYNGASITETEGILINGRNGVRIRLNADIGFLIEKNNQREFYVDTGGNLTFDGRLNITENGQTHLEAYLDDYGGVLIINDENGGTNVRLGSESGRGTNNRGGTLVLYDDDITKPRVQASILNENGGGAINLRDKNGNSKIGLYSENQQQPLLVIFGSNNVPSTYFTDVSGVIGGEIVATENWVQQYIQQQLANYATIQYVEDNFEPLAP